jgi:hypothetical protein
MKIDVDFNNLYDGDFLLVGPGDYPSGVILDRMPEEGSLVQLEDSAGYSSFGTIVGWHEVNDIPMMEVQIDWTTWRTGRGESKIFRMESEPSFEAGFQLGSVSLATEPLLVTR